MLEHHTGQKNLKVFRRRSKEQEELHRSQKNPLVHHISLKERQEHHKSLRLMEHHMNLKAGNQVKMQELAVLHRSLKKEKQKLVLHRNCWQRNQSGPGGLHKNLKGLSVLGCFHKSLLPVASCRSQ